MVVLYQLSYNGLLWVGRDSNPRSPKATDLQSVVIDRSTTYPNYKVLANS